MASPQQTNQETRNMTASKLNIAIAKARTAVRLKMWSADETTAASLNALLASTGASRQDMVTLAALEAAVQS
jgi:hypothetical protein